MSTTEPISEKQISETKDQCETEATKEEESHVSGTRMDETEDTQKVKDTNENDATLVSTADTESTMSKSQMKKRKRLERLMEIKKRKKQHVKDVKAAKALKEGRDLEAERRLQKERQECGEGRRRRQAKVAKRMESADTSFRVCVDCGFEDVMTYKEKNSLALQIRYCYAANKRSPNPVHLSVSSLTESGVTHGQLKKVNGFPDQWQTKAFSCSEEPLETVHADKDRVVYLTSDSDHTLEHLDDSKVYVIGGIVDRNRLKGATSKKAEELGIVTARLPIDDHLKLDATKVLTVNHVFDILIKYRELGNDWKKALINVLPQRKDVTEVEKSENQTDQPKKDEETAKDEKLTNEEDSHGKIDQSQTDEKQGVEEDATTS